MTEAYFSAGCFWGVEQVYRECDLFGKEISATTVGYMGGAQSQPTYKDVKTGTTGHAETLKIVYDGKTETYAKLLQMFWDCHDPTLLNMQGPDVGTQYRTAIWFTSPAQESAAKKSLSEKQADLKNKTIATTIKPATEFWTAEDYHQQYHEKNGGTCSQGVCKRR